VILETLGQACEKTGWQVHAYCLMSNHFHLVVETPQPNLVAGMKWLLGTYTRRRPRRTGKRLRSQTTMSLKWIAARLKMGAWTYVSNCLVQRR
jgi:REP element-mobilizing transposase RayT